MTVGGKRTCPANLYRNRNTRDWGGLKMAYRSDDQPTQSLRLEVASVSGVQYPQHHIKAMPDEISRYCFVPGDHIRGRKIAERLENVVQVSANRAIFVHTGTYRGVKMTVCSTGMGGPQAAIAIEELGMLGADTFIRVGSAGALQPGILVGDIAIATAAYRDGGATRRLLPMPFPAVADFHVTQALLDAAHAGRTEPCLGVVCSTDIFYAQPDPAFDKMLADAGALCIEMETDTLFILGHVRKFRCGALFVMDTGDQGGESGEAERGKASNGDGKPWADHAAATRFLRGEDNAIEIALEAMRRLAMADGA